MSEAALVLLWPKKQLGWEPCMPEAPCASMRGTSRTTLKCLRGVIYAGIEVHRDHGGEI